MDGAAQEVNVAEREPERLTLPQPERRAESLAKAPA